MAKRLFTNKKFLAGLIIIALGTTIIFSGITGAWWHIASGENDSKNTTVFQMGELGVAVTLTTNSDDQGKLYEPGDFEKCGISIENNGNIEAFVKLNFKGSISDEYGTEGLYGDISISFNDNITGNLANNITVEGDGSYFLFGDGNDNFYLYITPRTTVIMGNDCILIDFTGSMNNNYMGELISVTLDWEATQYNGEAIMEKFGVDLDELEEIASKLP